MNIRHATQADFPAIARLHARSWQDAYRGIIPDDYLDGDLFSYMKERWAGVQLQGDDILLVAEEGDAITGFIATWCRPDAFIDNLHVDPDLRSKGLGKTLMQAAADTLTKRGYQQVYLWVLEGNPRAKRFYERLGGAVKETVLKDLVGQSVPHIKMVWNDLPLLAGNTQQSA